MDDLEYTFLEKIRKYAWIGGLLILAGGLVLYLLLVKGEYAGSPINYDARVSESSLCSGLDSSTGKPLVRSSPIKNSANLYVCGYLESDYPIDLLISWLKGENRDFIYGAIPHPIYNPGYFASKLELDRPLSPGKYFILIDHAHNTLVTLEFEVVDSP